jgi:molecular chaperone DnaJ
MALKDYYELLEISPGAPEASIRKAYRKLAMRYHPDRNVGNPFAVHHFREIQEAYEVLSNPVRRNEYHHKKWMHQPGNRKNILPVTPEEILQEAIKIERYVAVLDIFRMNKKALSGNLLQLLNDSHLGILEEKNRSGINEKIVLSVLKSVNPLPYPFLHQISNRLLKVAGAEQALQTKIQSVMLEKKQQYLWDKYKGLLMLLIALGISFLIYKIA